MTITTHSLATRKYEGQEMAMVIAVLSPVSDEEVSKGRITIVSLSPKQAKTNKRDMAKVRGGHNLSFL